MTDLLKKYLLPDHSTRIQVVRLTQAWQTGLAHQSYPPCIQALLGELVSAAVLLASNIKFDGSLVLQLQGDGPVALIVVECTSTLKIRATVTLREGHSVPEHGTLQTLLNHQGQGRFIVVLDPDKKSAGFQPYQGVVPLEGDSVAQVLEHYMQSSEQLETRLWLVADANCSAGLLLQRLPHNGGTNQPENTDAVEETWSRINQLAATLTTKELLDLESDTLIHRLFWEESLQTFEPQRVNWHCPCSRERVAAMLQNLGQVEINDILQERGTVDITCNFCGKPYHFDAVDCAGLFVQGGEHKGNDTLH
jgi:molecular chaperone Hsp33